MTDRICGNCRYFCVRDRERGECRLNPPVVIVEDRIAREGVFMMESRTIFPTVYASEWCGKWEQADVSDAPSGEDTRRTP